MPPVSCRGLSFNENIYCVETHVLVCAIKMKKIAIHFCSPPGYPRKFTERCEIQSSMCAALNSLTSHPVKGELSLTVRYTCR